MSKRCDACGARKARRFENETFTIEHQDGAAPVESLSGWRCTACGEVVFDDASARRYAAASDDLVMRARQREQEMIRRIRLRLGLTQAEAARLTGGGPNAFSRYERGKARPIPAVLNLLRLLDTYPHLLRELPGAPANRRTTRTDFRSRTGN